MSALLGAYVLGAVDTAEAERIEAHLEDCAACRHELGQLQEAAAALPSAPEPTDDLWRRIVEEVRAGEEAQDGKEARDDEEGAGGH